MTNASPCYGTANPKRSSNELLYLSIQRAWSASNLRQHLGVVRDMRGVRHDFSHSSYRDAVSGPFWSRRRFGRSSTSLLDGRIVHVAGEHEDCYDADFCIYSDVVVVHPDGHADIYLYPKYVFPPTDFPSATLVGRETILIGSLGYADLRLPGETQVSKLNTETLCIERAETAGESPRALAADRLASRSRMMFATKCAASPPSEIGRASWA